MALSENLITTTLTLYNHLGGGMSDVTTEPLTSDSDLDYEYQLDSIVSDSVTRIALLIIFVIMCGAISVAGIIANIINIIVFFRQGPLSDSSTLCLLALAFSDIGCLLPVVFNSVCFAIVLTDPVGLYLHPVDFMEVSTIWIHIMFVQITSWITVYISFERCICVLLPFKVKRLFSAKRSLVVVATIAVLFTHSFIPIFASLILEEVLDPETNTSSMIFVITDQYREVTMISDYIQALVLRTLAVIIVFVCIQITIHRVNLSKTWRQSLVGTQNKTSTRKEQRSDETAPEVDDECFNDNRDNIPKIGSKATSKSTKDQNASLQRERRLVRMITIINAIFLVCNAPDVVGVYLLHTVPVLRDLSHMNNLFTIMMSIQFCLESFNSAVNIVVYYKMSTRYRHELRAWLGWEREPVITK